MEYRSAPTNKSAARIMASTFGFLSGLGGITHGVGEMLQGNVSPSGIVINSWTQGPIATNMGGEPAMTIMPNLLVTGLLTIIFSLATIVWSVIFVQRKLGGLVLLLLSIAMLLVGAGFAPPILGILAGVAGLGINAHTWWGTRLPINIQHFLTGSWPWVFGICLINGVFLVVGSIILVYCFELNNPDLFVNSFFFAIVTVLLSNLTGAAYDVQKGNRVIVFKQNFLVQNLPPTQRAADGGESTLFSGPFPVLSGFCSQAWSTPHPTTANANRWSYKFYLSMFWCIPPGMNPEQTWCKPG